MTRITTLALCLTVLGLSSPLLQAQDTLDQTTQAQTRAKQERQRLLQLRREQQDAWQSLPRATRAAIAPRCKYMFRIGDDLIIDAYELFYWQDEASNNVRATKTTSIGQRAMGVHRDTYSNYVYDHDERFRSYFALSGQPAYFWYRGVLLNDESNWTDERLQDIITLVSDVVDSARANGDSRDAADIFDDTMRLYFALYMPRVFAVDPLIKTALAAGQRFPPSRQPTSAQYQAYRASGQKIRVSHSSTSLYATEVVPDGFQVSLANGAVAACDLLWDMTEWNTTDAMRTWDLQYNGACFIEGAYIRNGIPKLDRWIMFPVGTTTVPDSTTLYERLITPATVLYNVELPGGYSMTAGEVALAFVKGELEIYHRRLERVGGGIYRASENTCEREEVEREE